MAEPPTANPPAAPAAATPAAAGRVSRLHGLKVAWQLLLPALLMLLLLAAMVGAVVGSAVWLLRSEEGTAWLLARAPGLESRGLRGALLSERFSAEHIGVKLPNGVGVQIDGLQGEGMVWRWRPERGAWFGLDAARLQARRVVVGSGPRGARPLPLPRTLQAPLRVRVAEARVDELLIDALAPLRGVAAQQLLFGAQGGEEHRIESLAFDWDRVHATAQGRIGAKPPYAVVASAALSSQPQAETPWAAEVQAGGTIARLELTTSLRGTVRSGQEAQALDLAATLVPLEDWPIAKLTAHTRALDLGALHSAAPRTRLSGSVAIATRALDAPMAAEIALDNALPGRWDEQKLPLRRIEASVQTRIDRRDQVDLKRLDLVFGSSAEAAGSALGSGQWLGDTLRLALKFEGLRPRQLDSRATAMTLSGPVEFAVQGLPAAAPPPAAGAKPPAQRPLAAEAKGVLEGRVDGARQSVQLSFDASAAANRLELRQLRAQAGAAAAAMNVTATRNTSGGSSEWSLRSEGTLTDFDPLPWWPGSEGSAWRQGPHRLSSSWTLDLRIPTPLRGGDPLTVAQSVAGSGSLRLADSVLAGVPLAGRIDLGHRPAAGAPSQIQGELTIGGNRLSFDGEGDPLGTGSQDRMRVELQADNVATLAPLARLIPGAADWLPRGGKATAALAIEGRWPDVRTDGRATMQGLQLGELTVAQGRAGWRIDNTGEQPLAVQIDGSGIELARQRLAQLTADLRGTLREHRLDLTAALPVNPPRALELALGLPTRAGTLARLQAEGAWRGEGGGGRWSGRVVQGALGAWDGSGSAPVGGVNWVDAKDLRAELVLDAQAGFTQLQAAAGQMRLADSVTLRWDDIRVDLRGNAPAFELHAVVEPFALAPLLARTQPTMGWGGDLRLAARVDVKAAEKLDADIVFERRDGDLRIADDNGVVTIFGLDQVQAALNAHDGSWLARAAFSGRTVGVASATLNLRPRPEQRWPSADTPIEGVIEASVGNLGIWSPWVPPGWRLSGAMNTSAKVSGRIGNPDYSGEIRADKVAVRNLLLGVDLREGEVRIALAGSQARIERFALMGGDGLLTVSGSAELGASPSAQLAVKAEHFRLLGRLDRQLITSGNATLGLTLDQIRLNGKFGIDEGLFDLARNDAPSLDDDVTVRRGGVVTSDKEPAPEPLRTRRQNQIALDIDLGEKLRVRGRGLDTTLRGNLKVGTSAGRITLQGIVDATGGTYAAYGQKLEIERGIVVFANEPDNPTLDVLALRPNIDMRVGVEVSGFLRAPRVRLYSSTDMSETDKLSWLVLGRATDGLGRTDAALLQRAAIALLAGEGEAPTDAVLRRLGIDELSLTQREGEVRETVISLGKQISQRLYFGYARGVNATSGTFELIYRIAQRFTLRARSGQENSLDVIWTWRLQDPPPRVPKSTAAAPP